MTITTPNRQVTHEQIKDLALTELDLTFGHDSTVRYSVLTPEEQQAEQPQIDEQSKVGVPQAVLVRITKKVRKKRLALSVFLSITTANQSFFGAKAYVAAEVERMSRVLNNHPDAKERS